MSTGKIRLSPKAKGYVLKLCKKIKERAPKNKMAIKMSTDMANTAMKYETLSSKQIDWLCDNGHRVGINLPPELTELMSENRGNDDFESNVNRRLSRLEKQVRELRAT